MLPPSPRCRCQDWGDCCLIPIPRTYSRTWTMAADCIISTELNKWTQSLKKQIHLGFSPSCPGLLCLGQRHCPCPLSPPTLNPVLAPIKQGFWKKLVGPLQVESGPAPFSQNLIEEDGETFSATYTQRSFWSLVPTFPVATSLFLEESAVRSWKGWMGSVGCSWVTSCSYALVRGTRE